MVGRCCLVIAVKNKLYLEVKRECPLQRYKYVASQRKNPGGHVLHDAPALWAIVGAKYMVSPWIVAVALNVGVTARQFYLHERYRVLCQGNCRGVDPAHDDAVCIVCHVRYQVPYTELL